MSREVKFRIWDKTSNRMLYQDDFERVELDTKNKMVSLVRSETIESSYVLDYEDGIEAEIMQYTGLKDKSGKEIYEGDIVKLIPLNSERLKELGRKWYEHLKVEWGAYSDGEYVTNVETWMIGINPLSEELLDETVEVIGNIYENPELLEGES
ncbi:YopX family protein [Clostridium perfringens]|uniref:YopX family protein n=1 Tax=Clostridium perfringens TaxID=1502 RepID=UPI001A3314E8|nr:YopX family protein [Clostridium perfringens]ELC8411543.1 hypothetical protein [Clostridium perfringens]MDM0804573.1 YopX family protein [Clostridium perfringens]HAT4259226.1 hypothetical protein [Clostridium perfringens]